MKPRSVCLAIVLAAVFSGGAMAQTVAVLDSSYASENRVGSQVPDPNGALGDRIPWSFANAQMGIIMAAPYAQPGSHEVRVPLRMLSMVYGRTSLKSAVLQALDFASQN